MADKDKNYTKIANEILESMAKTKLSPTQYRILFVVWRNTYGYQREEHRMSLPYIASATGCDKRSIQRELKKMIEMKILNESYERQTRCWALIRILTNGLLLAKLPMAKLPMANLPKLLANCQQYYWRNSQPKERIKKELKENRKEVFDYYLSLGLIQHKNTRQQWIML